MQIIWAFMPDAGPITPCLAFRHLPAGIAGSTAPSTQDSRRCGSHSIHLDHDHENEHEHDTYGNLQSPFATHARPRALSASSANSGGLGAGTVSLVRRLGRLLAEGRSQARRLVGREAGLVRGGAGFTRKRSFNSRSSNKSEVRAGCGAAD